jgi:hypothetical protein
MVQAGPAGLFPERAEQVEGKIKKADLISLRFSVGDCPPFWSGTIY